MDSNIKFNGKNVPIETVAKIIGKDQKFVEKAMIEGVLPIGAAVRKTASNVYDFYVSPKLLYEVTGVIVDDSYLNEAEDITEHLQNASEGNTLDSAKWLEVKEKVREELNLSSTAFNTWIAGLEAKEQGDKVLIIAPADMKQALNYVKHNYANTIRSVLNEKLNRPVEVCFVLEEH